MKRSFGASKGSRILQKNGNKKNEELVIDWELRPGGLLVQKRGFAPASSTGPMIKVKVSHDSYYHDLTVPTHSTFGNYPLNFILSSAAFFWCVFPSI